ncbi:MAG: hypothetical protein BA874_05980 [Desulfuromonadales bacterium C00003068]|nr:MAG: hypothetical protein BA874_05980 [Desulfuromonadales bacterium C00003068]
MNKLCRIRAIQVCMVLVVSCLCISCSHLNVDFDSSWSARDITVVVVEHEQAPDEVTTADIVNVLTRSGWHVVAEREQAQARVVCRWVRQTELTAESEIIDVVKSFHVQVISVEQPKVLAVSDYFYSNNDEELLDGVNVALIALTQVPVVPALQPVLPKDQSVAPQIPVVTPVLVPTVKLTTLNPASSAQVVSATQPVAQQHVDEKSIDVDELSSVVTEQASAPSVQQVLPMEPAVPVQHVLPLESAQPVSMEKSPWVPRFQGMGLEEWGKE